MENNLILCKNWYEKGFYMEKDFVRFLSDVGYANHTVNVYLWKLKQFATENGYNSLTDLADDVFILLDKGMHGDRKFDADTLSEIKKYENVLILFNSFLFDIGFKRQFVFPCSSSANYMQILTTDRKYVPGVCSRTLIDIDKSTGKKTDKQWFSIQEVSDALHVSKNVLTRWNKLSEKEKLKKYIPHRYKGKGTNDVDLSCNANRKHEFGFSYYLLDELNDFLLYQFYDSTGVKREQYLSDEDIRKKPKSPKVARIR